MSTKSIFSSVQKNFIRSSFKLETIQIVIKRRMDKIWGICKMDNGITIENCAINITIIEMKCWTTKNREMEVCTLYDFFDVCGWIESRITCRYINIYLANKGRKRGFSARVGSKWTLPVSNTMNKCPSIESKKKAICKRMCTMILFAWSSKTGKTKLQLEK